MAQRYNFNFQLIPSHMNKKQYVENTISHLKSPTCTQTSEYKHTTTEFQLNLNHPNDSHTKISSSFSKYQSKCATQRPLEHPEINSFDFDLVLNSKSFCFRCSDIWNIEKELSDAFLLSGISPKIQRALRIVIYNKISKKNHNFRVLLQHQLQQYGNQLLPKIEQILGTQQFPKK